MTTLNTPSPHYIWLNYIAILRIYKKTCLIYIATSRTYQKSVCWRKMLLMLFLIFSASLTFTRVWVHHLRWANWRSWHHISAEYERGMMQARESSQDRKPSSPKLNRHTPSKVSIFIFNNMYHSPIEEVPHQRSRKFPSTCRYEVQLFPMTSIILY